MGRCACGTHGLIAAAVLVVSVDPAFSQQVSPVEGVAQPRWIGASIKFENDSLLGPRREALALQGLVG